MRIWVGFSVSVLRPVSSLRGWAESLARLSFASLLGFLASGCGLLRDLWVVWAVVKDS
jgi:hypothetical protein